MAEILNWQDGVSRVVNNRGLYAKLLGRFCTSEKDAASRIAEALSANDMEKASHLTHSLKGTAANLGAEALSQAALELESFVKAGGSGDSAPLLAELQRILDETLQAMADFKP